VRRWIQGLLAGAALLLAAMPAWALSPVIMFFDSGSARITARAAAILDYTVAFIRRADVRAIEITGSTDRAGTDAANLLLSRRRAEAVRDALLGRGLSRHVRIRIVAAAEGQPIVRTEDGVAHPENRNVTILFSSLCTEADGTRLGGGECATLLPD